MNFFDGKILAFDKPYRATSFSEVGHLRWLLTKRMTGHKIRVGHAGTLDPLATGTLIICTGRATRIIESLQTHTKEYIAEVRLGETTASYDLEHPVDQTYPTEHITEAMVREVLHSLEGDIMQIPPAYSACKINGDRAYQLARNGEEVPLKAKPVRVEEIELLEMRLPDYLKIRVVCGKGTYIRSIGRDIGERLGSGAHLLSLRRTRVGDIRVEDCWKMEDFERWLERQTLETEPPSGPIPSEFPFLTPANCLGEEPLTTLG